jgi:hypothetical protein
MLGVTFVQSMPTPKSASTDMMPSVTVPALVYDSTFSSNEVLGVLDPLVTRVVGVLYKLNRMSVSL